MNCVFFQVSTLIGDTFVIVIISVEYTYFTSVVYNLKHIFI